jgi:heptosyltransferase-2
MRSILIIQTAFIGDVVLATALAEKLHRQFPMAAIDFLLRKGNEGLLNGHPFIREVMVWNKQKQKTWNKFRLLSVIRERDYDLVVNVQRYLATGLLTAFSGAARTVGFDLNPMSRLFSHRIPFRLPAGGKEEHEVERNQRLIAHLTEGAAERPRLYPSASDIEMTDAYRKAGAYVCIAPASVRFTKTYPPVKWISFINRIPDDFRILLIGSGADHALCESIRQEVTQCDRVINLAGALSLLQTAALESHALMNYTNDSAPLHLASAMNAPVTAVFCSTTPAFGYGPISDTSHIVQTEASLACRPCGDHGKRSCPKGHFLCAENIRDEQLLGCLPRS